MNIGLWSRVTVVMFAVMCVVLFVAAGTVGARALEQRTVTVLAAISLREALTGLAAEFEKQTGAKVELVFGSSGQLMSQVRNGAPADVFVSAAQKQATELIDARLADESSRTIVATNRLVLVVAARGESTVKRLDDLRADAVRRIAIGEPKSVPAGMYAMQALAKLRLESSLKDKLVFGANVKQVADYIVRGEVDAGLVYASDSFVVPALKVVETVPASAHEPIEYPGLVLTHAIEAELGRQYLGFLGSERARTALTKAGFGVPTPASTQNAPADSR
jgi:molybdate transport system substrate-binding protein